MSQILRPDGDDSQSGDWQEVPDAAPITWWDKIDETTANDADYVWQDATADEEYFMVTMSDALTPAAGIGTMKWRQKRLDGKRCRSQLKRGRSWRASSDD